MTYPPKRIPAMPPEAGIFVALVSVLISAAVSWLISRLVLRENTARELLSEALAIQALEEAWIVEGYDEADRSIKVNDNPKLEEERGSGKLWLRRVEVRAVLDEAEWNSPSEEPYGFVGTRRAWIVRNEIRGQPRLGPTKKHYPALISSRGKEELCGWIEHVRNANARPLFPLLKTLSDKDLDLLRPLLLQLAREDIVRILARNGSLTSESVCFLERIRMTG
jgi:hypothetical protein